MNAPAKKPMRLLAGRFVMLVTMFVILVALLVIYLNRSLGWFSQNEEVTGNGMSVLADLDDFPDMNAWRFDMDATLGSGDNTDENGDHIVKEGSWVSAIDPSGTTNVDKTILPVVENGSGGTLHSEQYMFRSLHLGTVDNLLTLSNDNCFYLRFDVTQVIYRSAIGYSLSDAGIHIFDQSREECTTEVGAIEGVDVLGKFVELFLVDAAVSTSRYEPNADLDEINALFYTTENNVTTRTGLLTNGGALLDLGEFDGPYYIYVRFSPDLDKCFEATDHIVTYMPCEITFDFTLSITFDS